MPPIFFKPWIVTPGFPLKKFEQLLARSADTYYGRGGPAMPPNDKTTVSSTTTRVMTPTGVLNVPTELVSPQQTPNQSNKLPAFELLPTGTTAATSDTALPGLELSGAVQPFGAPENLSVDDVARMTALGDLVDPSFTVSPELQLELEETVKSRLTPEALSNWLATDEGKAWVGENREVIRESLKSRISEHGPGLGLTIVGLLGAEKLANVMGLHDPHARLAFIILSMHGFHQVAEPAMGVFVNRFRHRPFDFAKKTMVRTGEGEALRIALGARNGIGRAIGAAILQNFGKVTAKSLLLGSGRMAYGATMGIGSGIAASRITSAVLGNHVSASTREWASFGAFLAPDALRIVTGARGTALSNKVGLGAIGRLFGSGFVVDLMTMGMQTLVWGSKAEYRRNIEMRMADRSLKDAANVEDNVVAASPGYYRYPATVALWAGRNARSLFNFVAPVGMAWARSIDLSYTPEGSQYEHEIIEGDRADSVRMQQELPAMLTQTLVNGDGGHAWDADFFDHVDFSMLTKEMDVSRKAEGLLRSIQEFPKTWSDAQVKQEIEKQLNAYSVEERFAIMDQITARRTQKTLADLHFMRLQENEAFQTLVDDKGCVSEDRLNDVIAMAFPGKNRDQVERDILDLRKASLIVRILETPEKDRASLLELAHEVKLADRNGHFLPSPLYFGVLKAWASEQSPERRRAVDARLAEVVAESLKVSDDDPRSDVLTMEAMILSGIDEELSKEKKGSKANDTSQEHDASQSRDAEPVVQP